MGGLALRFPRIFLNTTIVNYSVVHAVAEILHMGRGFLLGRFPVPRTALRRESARYQQRPSKVLVGGWVDRGKYEEIQRTTG